jgi:hypothetical protein
LGVYLLGAVTLLASRYVVPERLYPWLDVISGLIIAGLGAHCFCGAILAWPPITTVTTHTLIPITICMGSTIRMLRRGSTCTVVRAEPTTTIRQVARSPDETCWRLG